MHILYIISVFIHIIAVISWLGGGFFIALMFFPAIRKAAFRQTGIALLKDIGPKLRHSAWISFLLLTITGIFNLYYRFGFELLGTVSFWQSTVGIILLLKLSAVIVILLLSAYHDFYIGPKATKALMKEANSQPAANYRQLAAWCGRINIILGVMAVLLAIILLRGI